MRTLIIGASGQLGNDLMRAFADDEPIGVDHAMVDIEAPSAIATLLAHHRPDLVINTAAFHNVELVRTTTGPRIRRERARRRSISGAVRGSRSRLRAN